MADWNTELYLLNEEGRNKAVFDLISHIPLKNPGRVLDIGCGPGNSTIMLRKTFPGAEEVIGLDSSPNMIAKAREAHGGITWLQRDINEGLSDLGRFDILFSNSVMHWLQGHAVLLPRLFELLGAGGVAAFQIPYFLGAMYEEVSALAGSEKWNRFFPVKETAVFHDIGFYYDILSSHFSVFDLWTTKHTHVLRSLTDILDFYTPTGFKGYFDQLESQELREEFAADLLLMIGGLYSPQRDGKYLLRVERFFFVAWAQMN